MIRGKSENLSAEEAITLSLCMIVKNEAHFLARCLDAVKDHVDEIIIVDTGSTDETRAIAAQYTDRIYDFEWCDDFAAARNHALEQASGDWILVLDADEWMEAADATRLRQIIADTDYDAFFLTEYNYSNNPLEKGWIPVEKQTPYSMGYAGYRKSLIARLFRNRQEIRYRGRIHEVIDHSLEAFRHTVLEMPLHHHGDADPTKPQQVRQLNYLRMMEKELEREPDNGRLHKAAASVCMYQKQNYRGAIEHFKRAAALDYERNECLEGTAEAHYRLAEYAEAYRIYQQLFQSGYRTFTLCNNLANLLVKMGEFGSAAQVLRLALSMGKVGEDVAARLKHNLHSQEDKARQ